VRKNKDFAQPYDVFLFYRLNILRLVVCLHFSKVPSLVVLRRVETMELVYTVAKSARYKRRDFVFRDDRLLINLSSRNSLALCTTASLTEDKAEQYVVSFFVGVFTLIFKNHS